MNDMRRLKLMILWTLLATAATAGFWAIWHLVAGEVPEVTSLAPGWTQSLPFDVSRWWDVPVAALWALVIVTVLTSDGFYGNDRQRGRVTLVGGISGIIGGALMGLGLSLCNQLIPALTGMLPLSALVMALTMSVVLISELIADGPGTTPVVFYLPVGFGIGSGFTEGMPTGLALSLFVAVIFVLLTAATLVGVVLYDRLADGGEWRAKVGNCLTDKEVRS